ncbi:MAG: beta-ketoacyl synthase chain length factor [Rhizobacter sp.]|nr:beta-ketoacyl synthase chain length factor [Rhizobacter sp.]
MKVFVQGIGLLGPGLPSWADAQSVLRGNEPHRSARTVVQAPAQLPPAERRRAGNAIKVAMAVADQAMTLAGIDPKSVATVFTSSSGEGSNCHAICESLASGDRLISPTRFTNSVHNAPAGYWHIAVANRSASTSLCAFDDGFAAGLLEALSQVHALQLPILLVASDTPYPEPLNATRPLPDCFGLALVLTPVPTARSLASLRVELVPADLNARATVCDDGSLESLRTHIPAARALPLMQRLAQGDSHQSVMIEYRAGLQLQIEVGPGDSR